jgi:hypothetical protein
MQLYMGPAGSKKHGTRQSEQCPDIVRSVLILCSLYRWSAGCATWRRCEEAAPWCRPLPGTTVRKDRHMVGGSCEGEDCPRNPLCLVRYAVMQHAFNTSAADSSKTGSSTAFSPHRYKPNNLQDICCTIACCSCSSCRKPLRLLLAVDSPCGCSWTCVGGCYNW